MPGGRGRAGANRFGSASRARRSPRPCAIRSAAAAASCPPTTARLLGELICLTALDAFDALAPTDDVGRALALVVRTADGAADPGAAVRALATRREGR